jgi:hypothetical protein
VTIIAWPRGILTESTAAVNCESRGSRRSQYFARQD